MRVLWVTVGVVGLVVLATIGWLVFGYDLPARGRVHLTPFLDLVMAWNTGISYGLFQHTGPLGQWLWLSVEVVAIALAPIEFACSKSFAAARM